VADERVLAWLERTLGQTFDDAALLDEALTHRSATGQSNERLEFLGDAVLDFVVSHVIYEARPDAPEGDLSRLRAALVNDACLAGLATALGLGEHVRLGSGEKKSGGHRRSSILADALEALIGAVYLDRGIAAAEAFVRRIYGDRLDALPDIESLKDAKTRLQERLQAKGLPLPEYAVTEVAGQPHRRRFSVTCRVPPLGLEQSGEGGSRRAAEQAAAALLLKALDEREAERP